MQRRAVAPSDTCRHAGISTRMRGGQATHSYSTVFMWCCSFCPVMSRSLVTAMCVQSMWGQYTLAACRALCCSLPAARQICVRTARCSCPRTLPLTLPLAELCGVPCLIGFVLWPVLCTRLPARLVRCVCCCVWAVQILFMLCAITR